jgi:hypothetical protein
MILFAYLIDERFILVWIPEAKMPLLLQEHPVSLVSGDIGEMHSPIFINIGVDVRPGVYREKKDDKERKD